MAWLPAPASPGVMVPDRRDRDRRPRVGGLAPAAYVLPGGPNAGQAFWPFLHGLNDTSNLVYPFAADTSTALEFGVGIVASFTLAGVLLGTKGRSAGTRGRFALAD